MIWRIVLAILIGYLLGNLNGAIMISTHVFHDDVRQHGSGNAGMTNFLRTFGGKWLLPVILIDVGKTCLACLAGWLLLHGSGYGPEGKMLAGLACMVGHALPVFYGFHGGKGVLAAGALGLCMHWWTMLIALAVFFLILGVTHYMSLASMVGVTLWCVMAICVFWGRWFVVAALAAVAVMVIYLHRGNIQRLIHGTERKTYLHKPAN